MNQDLECTDELMLSARASSRKKKLVIVVVIAGVLAVGAGILIGLHIHNNNEYKANIKLAQADLKEGEYEQALVAYNK